MPWTNYVLEYRANKREVDSMYKKVEWMLTKSGEKAIKESGANKELMAERLLAFVNGGKEYHKEVVKGLYKGESCPHGLFIKKLTTGTYVIYMGFICYILPYGETLRVIDIQDLYKGVTGNAGDAIGWGTSEAVFDIKAAIAKDPRSKLSTGETLV